MRSPQAERRRLLARGHVELDQALYVKLWPAAPWPRFAGAAAPRQVRAKLLRVLGTSRRLATIYGDPEGYNPDGSPIGGPGP